LGPWGRDLGRAECQLVIQGFELVDVVPAALRTQEQMIGEGRVLGEDRAVQVVPIVLATMAPSSPVAPLLPNPCRTVPRACWPVSRTVRPE
jgi:hypothetical protein